MADTPDTAGGPAGSGAPDRGAAWAGRPGAAARPSAETSAEAPRAMEPAPGAEEPPPDLPPAARRALAEAEARRAAAAPLALPPEIGGRRGPEPVRYGDWERKGIAVDF